MDIDDLMNSFRLAGRELFNHFFRLDNPWNNSVEAWLLEGRFSRVERVLFRVLVSEPAALPDIRYGEVQTSIFVELRSGTSAPIMVNRGIDSGSWDHPLREATGEARLLFVRFFDWDQLGYRDNRYARVQIDSWPSRPDVIGKHALIETQYVRFAKA